MGYHKTVIYSNGELDKKDIINNLQRNEDTLFNWHAEVEDTTMPKGLNELKDFIETMYPEYTIVNKADLKPKKNNIFDNWDEKPKVGKIPDNAIVIDLKDLYKYL